MARLLPSADCRRARRLAALYDLSQLLETGLDRETLAILVGLTEQGVNPEVHVDTSSLAPMPNSAGNTHR